MTIDIKALATDNEIRERLNELCEFEPAEDGNEAAWFSIDGADTFQVIGRDGGGGLFLTVPPSQQVLLVSSEGAAGVVADDADAFLTLMVWCPYWRDVLKFSAGGRLEEMQRAAQALEDSRTEDDDFAHARELLAGRLGLPLPDDPIGQLHRTITSSRAVVRAPDGWILTPLFGNFTIDDTTLQKACDH